MQKQVAIPTLSLTLRTGGCVNVVDAGTLAQALNYKSPPSQWAWSQIRAHGLIARTDYWKRTAPNAHNHGRPNTFTYFSLEAAFVICSAARGKVAKALRRQFASLAGITVTDSSPIDSLRNVTSQAGRADMTPRDTVPPALTAAVSGDQAEVLASCAEIKSMLQTLLGRLDQSVEVSTPESTLPPRSVKEQRELVADTAAVLRPLNPPKPPNLALLKSLSKGKSYFSLGEVTRVLNVNRGRAKELLPARYIGSHPTYKVSDVRALVAKRIEQCNARSN
jgi:phage anti-repressor protein